MIITRVIFHIDELSKWNLTLLNTKNLLKELNNEPFYIELLANSDAVSFYIQDSIEGKDYLLLKELAAKGVSFSVCNNSLQAKGIDPNSLPDFVHVVPSGVMELIKKQQKGYSYIKP